MRRCWWCGGVVVGGREVVEVEMLIKSWKLSRERHGRATRGGRQTRLGLLRIAQDSKRYRREGREEVGGWRGLTERQMDESRLESIDFPGRRVGNGGGGRSRWGKKRAIVEPSQASYGIADAGQKMLSATYQPALGERGLGMSYGMDGWTDKAQQRFVG